MRFATVGFEKVHRALEFSRLHFLGKLLKISNHLQKDFKGYQTFPASPLNKTHLETWLLSISFPEMSEIIVNIREGSDMRDC